MRELEEIAQWAELNLKLEKQPSRFTIKRILGNGPLIQEHAVTIPKHQKRRTSVEYSFLEDCLSDWVWDMYHQKVRVSEGLIVRKARNLRDNLNVILHPIEQIDLKLSYA